MLCPTCREELPPNARFNVNRGLLAALAEQSAAIQRETALVAAVRLAVKEAAELRQKLSLVATSPLGATAVGARIASQAKRADEQGCSSESAASLSGASARNDGSGAGGRRCEVRVAEGVSSHTELSRDSASLDGAMDAALRIQAAWVRWRWRQQRHEAASRIAAHQRRRAARLACRAIRMQHLEARKLAAAAAAREAAAAALEAAEAAATAATAATAAAAMAAAEEALAAKGAAEEASLPKRTAVSTGDGLVRRPPSGGRGGRGGRGVQVAEQVPRTPMILTSAQLDAEANADAEIVVPAAALMCALAPAPSVQWRRVTPKAAQQLPCPFFARGFCQNGDACSRSHDGGKKPRGRAVQCNFFAQGRCRYGSECQFSHVL